MADWEKRIVGSDVEIQFTPEGGSAITLETDFTKFSFDRSVDTVDTTAGNERQRSAKPTIEGMDFTITLYDANQSYEDEILPNTYGVLRVRKQGTGTGLPEFEMNVLLTGYSEEVPFDNILEVEITGQRVGPMIKEFGSVQS